ncbi:MAG: type II toxin-antitoxin system Phd/YefM family antitoxin [Actinomycetota bacterium]
MHEPAIPASQFKAKCLALLDQVADTHVSFVITKRGRPVAKVVPVDEPTARRSLKGSVTILTDREEDLFSTGEAWDPDDRDI